MNWMLQVDECYYPLNQIRVQIQRNIKSKDIGQ